MAEIADFTYHERTRGPAQPVALYKVTFRDGTERIKQLDPDDAERLREAGCVVRKLGGKA